MMTATGAGDLFAALPGGATHGARFYGDVIKRGAVAVLTDASGWAQLNRDAGAVPVLVHPEPRSVLGELAATVYGHPSERLAIIGVTGTSGKTTTTYLLASVLDAAARPCGRLGTVTFRTGPSPSDEREASHTTPEASDVQRLLREMQTDAVQQIIRRLQTAKKPA